MRYLLNHHLQDTAEKNPDNIYVWDSKNSFSYHEANIQSNRLANFLIDMGVKRHDRVAIVLPRSAQSLVALHGVLKAGAIYVAVNPKTPVERIAFILNDCDCKVLITNNALATQTLTALTHKKVILTEAPQGEMNLPSDCISFSCTSADFKSSCPENKNIDLDLAYILYTSGSTGQPKGVMISHRNVLDYAMWASSYFQIKPTDRIGNTSGVYFDLSVFDIYAGIFSGAATYIISDSALLFPKTLVEQIDKERLTILNAVPSLYNYVAKMGVLKKDSCHNLSKLIFCGEVMPTQTIIDWMNVFPEKTYVNLYGPTETTCESMYYHIAAKPSDASVPIPIGKACANTEVFTLKEDLSLASIDEVGELCIRGSSNGAGYWKNPELTEKNFIRSPLNPYFFERVYRTGDLAVLKSDGNYHFVGRKDSQIKYMGYRIELGDIESALSTLECVIESVVICVNDEISNSQKLVGFLNLKEPVSSSEIGRMLRQKLPDYMVPKEFIFLDAIPKNANGKVDRLAVQKNYGKIT